MGEFQTLKNGVIENARALGEQWRVLWLTQTSLLKVEKDESSLLLGAPAPRSVPGDPSHCCRSFSGESCELCLKPRSSHMIQLFTGDLLSGDSSGF